MAGRRKVLIGFSAILALFFVGILVLAANPSWLVWRKVIEQGEYLEFEIGMNREQAVKVIDETYAVRKDVFFSAFENEVKQIKRVSSSELTSYSNWYVLFGGFHNSIKLKFTDGKLVYIEKYRNFYGV